MKDIIPPASIKKINSLKAIRLYCLQECQGGSQLFKKVKNCEVANCPLWVYRFGRNPHMDRTGKTKLWEKILGVSLK